MKTTKVDRIVKKEEREGQLEYFNQQARMKGRVRSHKGNSYGQGMNSLTAEPTSVLWDEVLYYEMKP